MTVAAASLQNLTPYPSTWGLPTQPIRVPVQFLGKVKEMVQNLVQQLVIQEGNEAPKGQTEQEWANEILGLPADYKVGDPLPSDIAEELEQIKQQNAQTTALSDLLETEHTIAPEPTRGTRDWINWQQEACGGRWEFPVYLKMLREEAAEGDESAKAELMAFRRNGLDCLVTDDPAQSRKQAKLARRAAVAKRAGAKVLDLSAIEQLTAKRSPNTGKQHQGFGYHNHTVESDKNALKLGKRNDLFFEHIYQARISLDKFLDEIKATCTPGKLEQYTDFLEDQNYCWVNNLDTQCEFINAVGTKGYVKALTKLRGELKFKFECNSAGVLKHRDHNDWVFSSLVRCLAVAWESIAIREDYQYLIDIPDPDTQRKLRLHGILPKQ
ncbi:MAG: hypothetical protein DI617_09160 [Streptococcus pyogenes]|nr:MAG: hypothetical protein DI617_09160 [Streptococcus pyogenes]